MRLTGSVCGEECVAEVNRGLVQITAGLAAAVTC